MEVMAATLTELPTTDHKLTEKGAEHIGHSAGRHAMLQTAGKFLATVTSGRPPLSTPSLCQTLWLLRRSGLETLRTAGNRPQLKILR